MDSVLIIENKPDIVWLSETSINDRINSNHYRSYMTKNELEIKNSGLEVLRIKDIVVKIRRGKGLKKDDSGEIPNYKVRNLTNFGINKDDVDLITHREFVNNKSSHIKIGDVLLASTGVGSLGKVDLFFDDIKATVDGHITILTTKEEYDGGYLKAYLQSRYGQIFIEQNTIGSTGQTELYAKDIGEILVPIPSPEIQKYIGDKVRRAEELREEAITLQKDIDILLDVDMLLEETDRINNIFHSKVNWTNEINIVDRIDPNFYQKKHRTTIEKLGDNKVELGELVKISKRRYQTGDINKYIEISSINNSFGTIDEVEELRPEEIPTSAKHQVKEGDILVSLVRPTRKAISIVTKEYDNAICTGGFAVLQSKGKVPVEFLTAVLRTNFAGIQFERYCTGSTYPTINENDVVKIFIPQYSEKQINKITEKYRRIIESIYRSKKLIQEAKQDVEDLIEGDFEMSELNNNSSTESRC